MSGTDLPEDILRLIIESYAAQSEKNDSLYLLSVSRDVKNWITPWVYSKIVLKSSNQVLSFAAALRGEYTFCRPNSHVRSLWLLCTDASATQHLNYVPPKCPNLVHFAFDGKTAPFSSTPTETNDRRPLTRLSICSPSLLDFEYYKGHPPVEWEHLTHLHIFGPGDVNDYDLYDNIHRLHLNHLHSLECLCIELTYPSPQTDLLNFTFYPDAGLFYIYLKGSHLLEMIERLPKLRKIVIKTSFTSPRFRVFWADLRKAWGGEPKISFEMKPLVNQGFYDSALPSADLSSVAWQTLLKNALEEVEVLWNSDI